MDSNAKEKYESAQQLHQVLLRLDRLVAEVDREVGATAAQLSALAAVEVFGKTTLKNLAAHEGVSSPTMARIVDSLVTRGWIERSVNAEDRRRTALKVTRVGKSHLDTACSRRTDLLVESLSDLSAKEWRAIGAASSALAKLFGYRER